MLAYFRDTADRLKCGHVFRKSFADVLYSISFLRRIMIDFRMIIVHVQYRLKRYQGVSAAFCLSSLAWKTVHFFTFSWITSKTWVWEAAGTKIVQTVNLRRQLYCCKRTWLRQAKKIHTINFLIKCLSRSVQIWSIANCSAEEKIEDH